MPQWFTNATSRARYSSDAGSLTKSHGFGSGHDNSCGSNRNIADTIKVDCEERTINHPLMYRVTTAAVTSSAPRGH